MAVAVELQRERRRPVRVGRDDGRPLCEATAARRCEQHHLDRLAAHRGAELVEESELHDGGLAGGDRVGRPRREHEHLLRWPLLDARARHDATAAANGVVVGGGTRREREQLGAQAGGGRAADGVQINVTAAATCQAGTDARATGCHAWRRRSRRWRRRRRRRRRPRRSRRRWRWRRRRWRWRRRRRRQRRRR